MADTLEQLFGKVGINNPDALNMLEFLKQRGTSPSVDWNPNLPMQYMGAYLPRSNSMEFDPAVPPSRTTAVHETTHAMDETIRKARPWVMSDGLRQLYDAYDKFQQPTNLKTRSTEAARISPEEFRAYGLGNMLYPSSAEFRDRRHVDATGAQEAAILHDLARRKLK
jgi:hypothetical protein